MSGAGVFVLGMHRSGTSAAARLVNLLGLPLGDERDRLGATAGNARGHWESTSLIDFDEALLGALGGAWWCPPRLIERWWDDPVIAARAVAGRAGFTAVHPGSRWVWKDPRACITLPFWRRALVARTAAVVIGRDPVEVAASLTARNRFSPTRGLQLWERYTHHLLPALAGLPVTFTTYDDLMTDPVGWSRRVAAFLAGQGFEVRVHPGAVRAFVEPGQRHHHPGDATAGAVPTAAQ